MNRKITVYFPSDYRKDFFKNDLLDGTNHEIYVEKVLAFNAERRQFYLVSGFDDTKKRSVAILLMKDGRFGGMLKKVPLMDYGEIDKYMKFPVALSDNEIDSLLKKSGYAFSSMPLTTISDILSQDRREEYAMENTKKLKVIVFYDRAGRKYILSSAAESLELPNPNTIKYLPLKNIAGRDGLLLKHHIHTTSGFRLLDNLEYTKISLEFDVERHEIEPVKIIDYQGRYFVKRSVFEGNDFGTAHTFYNFGDDLFDCVPISMDEKNFIDNYYVTNYQVKTKLTEFPDDEKNNDFPSKSSFNQFASIKTGYDKKDYRLEQKSATNKLDQFVFIDDEGRKFISSSVAVELGLPHPFSIRFLPLKNYYVEADEYNINCNEGYRLLSDFEYSLVLNSFNVTNIEIDSVNVINYQNKYFVNSNIYLGNDFGRIDKLYSFGNKFSNYVLIDSSQKKIIDTFYSTVYQCHDELALSVRNVVNDKSKPEQLKGAHFKR